MTKQPLVSIIIPYFKKKKYFKKTIHSIFSQSYQNFEIILIYDDLDLAELKFVKDTLKIIKKKKILINKKNLGPGISRNKGVLKSNGSFVAFCDADDVWNKDKLKLQITFMKNDNINFSHTDYSIIDKYSKIIGQFKIDKKLDYKKLIKSCDIGLSTVVGTKNLFLKNKFSSLKTKEDYQLWLRLLRKQKFISGMGKNLSSWRMAENSLSSSIIQKIFDSFKLYYYYEKYNIISSIFFVLRLTYFALLKKIKIYLLRG